MRQKLFEAYDYAPPSPPKFQAADKIEAKVGQNGIVMTNISDITNMKDSTSTTNMNKVGSLSFNSGMKMAKNSITGVETITGSTTSGTTISNVDQLLFTNTSSYISPSVALANSDENVIGYTITKTGSRTTTGVNNWSILTNPSSTSSNRVYPTSTTILATIDLTKGVWLINYAMLLEGMNGTIAVSRVVVGTDTTDADKNSTFIHSNQQGPLPSNGQAHLNGSFVYRATGSTSLSLYGYQTAKSANFVSNSINYFSATRLA